MKALITINLVLLALRPLYGHDFFKDQERGWFWYEVSTEQEEKKSKNLKVDQQKRPSPEQMIKKQRQAWQQALNRAILTPNEKNLEEYLRLTKKLNIQAETFADKFKKFIWKTPDYDYSIERPHNPQAIYAHNIKSYELEDVRLKQIAKTQGLLFFFKGNCPYCHEFAPVLQKFAYDYGFSLMALSLDGGVIEGLKKIKKGRRIAQQLGVKSVPAVFLLDPKTKQVQSVSFGHNSYSSLREKVLYVSGEH